MKLYYVIIPVIAGALADIATSHKIAVDDLEKRFLNIMHSELGKVDAERKEAKDGKTAGLWASLKVKKGQFTGGQTTREKLFLENGKTIATRVVDCYAFSAAVVKFEETFGEGLVGAIPPSLETWINGMAERLAAKAPEPVSDAVAA